MQRPGITLLFTATLLFGLALSGQTAPPASSAAPSAKPEPTAQEQAHQTLERIGPQLNLTADQKAKLEPILTNEIEQVRILKADTATPPEQKQAKFQAMMTADHTKIDGILTPEQKQKLTEMHQQQQGQQAAPPKPQAATPPKQ